MTGVESSSSDVSLSRTKAAELLAIGPQTLETMLRDGLLTSLRLDDVLNTREQGWVTMTRATQILGVNRARVDQLVRAGKVPRYQAAARRRRWFRRHQLEVIANARASRALSQL